MPAGALPGKHAEYYFHLINLLESTFKRQREDKHMLNEYNFTYITFMILQVKFSNMKMEKAA